MSIVYLGKATPASGSGGGSSDAVWGAITGTLSDQTDLAAALAEKQDVIDANNKLSASYVSGLATVATTGDYDDLLNKPTIPTVIPADNSTITENASNQLQTVGIVNQNTALGAVSPLKVWNGTEQEWNTGGGSQTWYNWEYTSGGSWISETSGASGYLVSVTYGNNKYIAVGGSGTILSSSDGSTWTSETSGVSDDLKGLTYGNNKYIAVGVSGTILSSSDGETWNSETSGAFDSLNDVTYGNNKFIAVGTSGVILSSSDGETWNSETSGVFVDFLQGVTYGNNKFIAVGSNGNILSSSDGETWNSETSGVSDSLLGVTYGNGKFIAVGWNGIILSSPDGSTWTREMSGVSGNLNDVTYGNGKFIAVGWNGIILSYSAAGVSLSCYTLESEPTTASTVYSEPRVTSALTITAVSTGTITLSDTNTYDYNASGNQTTTLSVGQAHQDWLCNIDGVGLKIGTTDVANLASYSAFTGATSQAAGNAGLVPAPTTGDVDKYLKGDGTWGAVSGGSGIQNTATGTDSLTILGTPATNDYCINIGINSTAVTGSLAIGNNAYASDSSIAIGTYDDEGNYYAAAYGLSVAIGTNAKAGSSDTYGAIAIGYAQAQYDYAIAIGCGGGGNSTTARAVGAIQIGYGENNTPNSLFVGFYDTINQEAFGNYQLLDGTTGKIPNDRINGVSGSFISQDGKTVTVTNGVITSIV